MIHIIFSYLDMYAKNDPQFINYINSQKPNSNIELQCPYCDGYFSMKKNIIQYSMSKKRKKYKNYKINTIYCGAECSHLAKRNAVNVNCLQCNKSFTKLPNQIKRHPKNFCSRSCAATYRNNHKITGTKRSRLEFWIESKLKELYSSLDIEYNKKEIINSELDIYIPSLRIAFELNGIFHYEPIYGLDRLLSIKNNDDRKFQACLEKGIELVIIDSSAQKHFTEKSSQKYLDIITNIVNLKLTNAS